MHQIDIRSSFRFFIGTGLILLFLSIPKQAHAQWPPFTFKLTPSYEGGRITYDILFRVSKDVDWDMTDVRIHIPLPEGTHYVEANAYAPTEVSFDGTEIRYFSSVLSKGSIQNATFIVEVIDSTRYEYAAHAWISWQGHQPGDYLTEDVSINTTYRALNWVKPTSPRLELETQVTTTPDTITYQIYPQNVKRDMWDVQISLPIPDGTSVISTDAPPPFVAGVNEHEVVFSALEVTQDAVISPLTVQVSINETNAQPIVTYVWTSWKNTGRQAGLTLPANEAIQSPDIIVQPNSAQFMVMDRAGDVPFANYDLVSVSLQEADLPDTELPALQVVFHTAGVLGTQDEPVEYRLYIDQGCDASTGERQRLLGAEYRVRYRHNLGNADLRRWDVATNTWESIEKLAFEAPNDGNSVTIFVPYTLLNDERQFCWLAKSYYRDVNFTPLPNTEYVPESSDLKSIRYITTKDVQGPGDRGETAN